MSNYKFIHQHLSATPASAHVLDVGAGPSHFRELTARFDLTTAIDIIPYDMVDVVADIKDGLPFGDNTYDVVLLSNVLEHVIETGSVLAESHRVLKNGGFVIGTIPFLLGEHQAPRDFHRYTSFMLEHLLHERDFRVPTVIPLGRPADVFETMQLLFFVHLLHDPLSTNRVVSSLKRLFAKVIWRCYRLQFRIFRPLFRSVGPATDYTPGYGFVGYRQD